MILLFIFLLTGLFWLGMFLYAVIQQRQCGEKVSAVFKRYDTRYFRKQTEGGVLDRSYEYHFPVFAYEYNDISYEGVAYQLGPMSLKELKSSYIAGKHYFIWVNADRPEIYVISKKIRGWGCLAWSVAFLLMAGLMGVIGV